MATPTPDSGDGAVLRALNRRRETIEARLEDLEAGALSAASGIGFGKRIGEGTNIAVERLAEVSMHDSLLVELQKVRRAQDRITAGDPAVCDTCGNEIGAARLTALPWATRCVACAV